MDLVFMEDTYALYLSSENMSITVEQVHQKLNDIMTSPQADFRVDLNEYRGLMNDILTHPVSTELIKMLKIIVETFVDENMSLAISRHIFDDFCSHILPNMTDMEAKLLGLFILDKMHQRIATFEDHVTNIRLQLSHIYEKEKNWKEALIMLVGNPIESGQKVYSLDYKLETYIRIARLYLEDDNPLQAESYINRAGLLQSVTGDENLKVCYNVTCARVLDLRLRFIEAAQKYNELSLRLNITESERMSALNSAIICTILSPTGNQRFQMLSTLYRDKRCQILIRFSLLEKMYRCRMLTSNEIDEIETMLLPHQKAKTKDNTSLLTEAMIEHNMLSISKLYKNIKIKSLAILLKIDPYKAEIIAGKMISEERMKGSIDQVDGFIHFQTQKEADSIPTWDKKIESLCCHVNRIIEIMSADSSIREWMKENFDNQMSL